MILDLGCGSRKREGAVGIDVSESSSADVIHDLNEFPYPFETSSAEQIYMDNVLEHLDNVIATLEEVHRLGQPGCRVRIDVPYFRSKWAAIDPTHRHFFTPESMAYFDPSHPFFEQYHYSSAKFSVDRVVYNERFPGTGLRGALARFANRWPERYEQYLSSVFPLDELTFFLRVVK
jgi:SAM-dependent methyltransferase